MNDKKKEPIAIFVNGNYTASTDWHTTCKDAKASVLKRFHSMKPEEVKCYF